MINKLRDFLVKHKALEEYILFVDRLYSSQDLQDSWRGMISGLFTWSEAEDMYGTRIDWNRLDELWLDSCDNSEMVPYCKDEFLEKLRVLDKKLRLLSQIKYYKD